MSERLGSPVYSSSEVCPSLKQSKILPVEICRSGLGLPCQDERIIKKFEWRWQGRDSLFSSQCFRSALRRLVLGKILHDQGRWGVTPRAGLLVHL